VDSTKQSNRRAFFVVIGRETMFKDKETCQLHKEKVVIIMNRITQAQMIYLLNGSKPLWLVNANLSGLDLSNANLEGADLTNADLSFARLGNANLCNAKLEKANFYGGALNFVNFTNANLQSCNLSNVNIRAADFTNADLRFSNLSNSILAMATFHFAKLNGAVFSGSLIGEELIETPQDTYLLGGADFTNAEVSMSQLLEARTVAGMILPNGREYR
jgi:uncharacterized protein YjbI with pentapeptide repeats